MGWYHGCTSYTHTRGVKPRYVEFSNAIVKRNKPAGVLTRLNNLGVPVIKGNNDLSNVKIADVVGWAPNKDGLSYEENSCTGKPFKPVVTNIKEFSISGTAYTENDIAV